MDLTGNDIRFIIDQPDYRPRIFKTKRVGIDYYARHWKNRRLRYIDIEQSRREKDSGFEPCVEAELTGHVREIEEYCIGRAQDRQQLGVSLPYEERSRGGVCRARFLK